MRQQSIGFVSSILFVVVLAVTSTPPTVRAEGDQWTTITLSAPWRGRIGHTSVVFNGKMWLLGGETGGESPYRHWSNDVWSSGDGKHWTSVTTNAAWTPRAWHCSLVYNNRIWVMGGRATGEPYILNDVHSSANGVTWTTATVHANWSPRYGAAAVVFNNKMWELGGTSDQYQLAPDVLHPRQVHSSVDGVNWTTETTNAAWPGRHEHAVVVLNGEMWLMGGSTANSPTDSRPRPVNDVWHSANGRDWTEAPLPAWGVRGGLTALVDAGRIWVMGGGYYVVEGTAPQGLAYNDVWSSPNGTDWTQVTASAVWSPRVNHTALAFAGRMWVLGGLAQAGPPAGGFQTFLGSDDVFSNSPLQAGDCWVSYR